MAIPPSVIYIGPQKTGSTFLRHYFWSHDEIYCDRHGIFFQTPDADIDARGIEAVRTDYAARFEQRPPRPCHIDMYEGLGMGYLFRERSTWDPNHFINPDETLLHGPARPEPDELARRIHTVLPNAKILITIRNQPAWLDSSYRHFLAQLPASRSRFVDFLDTPEGKISLDAGHFDRTVALYDRLFGSTNVLALPLERIERDEEAALRMLVRFLGVNWSPYPAERKNYNRGHAVSIDDLPYRHSHPSLVRRMLRRIRPPDTEIIPRDAVGLLRRVYAAGNARLAKRLDTDLENLGYPV